MVKIDSVMKSREGTDKQTGEAISLLQIKFDDGRKAQKWVKDKELAQFSMGAEITRPFTISKPKPEYPNDPGWLNFDDERQSKFGSSGSSSGKAALSEECVVVCFAALTLKGGTQDQIANLSETMLAIIKDLKSRK